MRLGILEWTHDESITRARCWWHGLSVIKLEAYSLRFTCIV